MTMMYKIGVDHERRFVRGCYNADGHDVVYVDLFGNVFFREDMVSELAAQLMARHYNKALLH